MEMKTLNSICVRIVDQEGICRVSFYTDNLSETLKMYQFAMKEGIEIDFVVDRGKETEAEYSAWIDDISIGFGNGDDLYRIDLSCEVI